MNGIFAGAGAAGQRNEGRARVHHIAVIAGDGIGPEVVPAAMRCLDAIAERHDFRFAWREFDWGSERFKKTGAMMPVDGLEQLRDSDAIFLGAVGDPEISDVETLWGLLIPIRRTFDQYVNLRPVRSLPGVPTPLVGAPPINLVIVRENVEGEYSAVGGRIYQGTPEEAAFQQATFTRRGVTRVAAYAADLALKRRHHLTSATKSNGIIHTMPFWDEVVRDTVAGRGVELNPMLIDALAARMVSHPTSFDVVVASNLFGDILSDLAGALAGSIGIAPSGNINPEGAHPSMFEPVHGSAPDIAGSGVADPVGQIWAGAMMLDQLGEEAAAAELRRRFEDVLADGIRTPDLGGSTTTDGFATAVVGRIKQQSHDGTTEGTHA